MSKVPKGWKIAGFAVMLVAIPFGSFEVARMIHRRQHPHADTIASKVLPAAPVSAPTPQTLAPAPLPPPCVERNMVVSVPEPAKHARADREAPPKTEPRRFRAPDPRDSDPPVFAKVEQPPKPRPTPRFDADPQLESPAVPPPPDVPRQQPPVEYRTEILIPPSRLQQAWNKVTSFSLLRHAQPKRGKHFIPARPLSAPLPVVPDSLRANSERRLSVVARLDENGRVVRVLADGPDLRLGLIAANTVRSWRFEPAAMDHVAVPSSVIIHFRFAPAAEFAQ